MHVVSCLVDGTCAQFGMSHWISNDCASNSPTLRFFPNEAKEDGIEAIDPFRVGGGFGDCYVEVPTRLVVSSQIFMATLARLNLPLTLIVRVLITLDTRKG